MVCQDTCAAISNCGFAQYQLRRSHSRRRHDGQIRDEPDFIQPEIFHFELRTESAILSEFAVCDALRMVSAVESRLFLYHVWEPNGYGARILCMGLLTWPLPRNNVVARFNVQDRGSLAPAPRPAPRATANVKERPSAAQVEETNALIRRCLQGDGHAWQQIVESQHRRVYALCYRFTGSPVDSEDLTQEVFLKVYRNLKTFDVERGSFQSWLTALTRNLLVDHFRRTRAEQTTHSLDAGWDDSDTPSMADQVEGRELDPLQRSIGRELQNLVQKALLQVSPELRQAVILRDLEDMDYKEIAGVLQIPEGTVKSRISRGRMELARLLERNKGQVM